MQTEYDQEPEKAFQGLIADGGPVDIITRALELAAGAPFGIALEPGTDPTLEVTPTTGSGFVFVGVAAHSHTQEDLGTQALDLGISDNEPVNVLRKGRIWVPIEQAVTPFSSPVFVRHTVNGGLDQLGAFRIDADTANAEAVTAVAEWQDSITIAGLPHNFVGLGLLSVNLPGA